MIRRILLVCAGLLLALGAFFLYRSQACLAPPRVLLEDGALSSSGPLQLVFDEPVDEESAESRLRLEPAVEGKIAWLEDRDSGSQTLVFKPDQPFSPGTEIVVRLLEGVAGADGRKLAQALAWKVLIRGPEILFLSPTDKPDLWRSSGPGAALRQITFTGGAIYDYGAAWDGTRIAYSARNDQGGLDLWEIGRDGGPPRRLLSCQVDWCFNPAYSPDGRYIAYSRQTMSALSAATRGPRIWLMLTETLSTEILLSDPVIEGIDAAWSPDGKFLAFYDEKSQGIRVTSLATRRDFLLPAAMGYNGSWSPDSQQIIFTDEVNTELGPFGQVYFAGVASQGLISILDMDEEQTEYSKPEWSPKGTEVAIAAWLVQGSAGKQIWIMNVDGSQRLPVTQDQVITNSSYHWSPAGDRLVFQRLELGSSDHRPWVTVWERETGSLKRIADDAFQPQWLP